MIPYYILYFVPLFLYFFERKGVVIKRKNGSVERIDAICISSFFLIFIILLALRSNNCGADVENYLFYFERYRIMGISELVKSDWTYDVEIGYRLFNYLFGRVSDNFQLFLALVAILSVVPICFLYKNESKNKLLVIALFLGFAPFSLYFSGLRQVLAMAFCVPAYYYSKNRKLIPFVLCVLLASLFHLSALIVFILYPIYRIKLTKKCLYVVVPLMTLLFVFNKYIFSAFLIFFRDTKYSVYTMSSTGAYGMILLMVFVSVYILVVSNGDDVELSADENGLRNILLLSTCLQFFAPLSTISMRMNYYFLIFVPISIDRLSAKASNRYKQIVRVGNLILIVFFFVYSFVNMHTSADILNIYPYIPFWE